MAVMEDFAMTNHKLPLLGATLVLSLLLACAPAIMTKEECMLADADWRAVGIHDGIWGEDAEIAAKRMRQCGKYDITLDQELYKGGYVDAVLHRCTKRYGELLGYTGHHPREKTCPEQLRAEFMQGYEVGRTNSVADNLDPLLSKSEARRKREEIKKKLQEYKQRREEYEREVIESLNND